MLQPKYRTKRQIIQYVIAVIVGIAIGLFVAKYNYKDQTITKTIPSVEIIEKKEIIPKSISKDELNIESTLRSCLGKYCFNSRPTSSSKDRIGILSLPHSGGEILTNYLNEILKDDSMEIELISTTNVPPYGYGKNHGWNSLIRLYQSPILQSELMLSQKNILTDELVDNQIRQCVRWHCRISHVAAHTRTLTIYIDDLKTRPHFEIDRILSYITTKKKDFRNKLLNTIDLQFINPFMKEFESYHGSISSNYDNNKKNNLFDEHYKTIAIKAMKEEYENTNGLKKWPCLSFRDLDKNTESGSKGNGIEGNDKVSSDINRLPYHSKALAANCSAPHVICSVGFDQRGG